MKNIKKLWFLISILLAMSVFFSGCSYLHKELSPASAAARAKYYQFDDIMVPSELKYNQKRSFVAETSGFKVGTLYFSGRVETDSLIAFFRDSMIKDGWTLKSNFRHTKSLHLFEKPGKSCIIIIEEKLLTTKVEIWVSPFK